MAASDTIIAAWVIVGVVTTACVVAGVCFLYGWWRMARGSNYRVSTIIISRTTTEDLESPPLPFTAGQLRAMGINVQGGDVCFLGGDAEGLCFICCERPPVDAMGACGHGGMCGACFARIWAYPNAKCPVCRGHMRTPTPAI